MKRAANVQLCLEIACLLALRHQQEFYKFRDKQLDLITGWFWVSLLIDFGNFSLFYDN